MISHVFLKYPISHMEMYAVLVVISNNKNHYPIVVSGFHRRHSLMTQRMKTDRRNTNGHIGISNIWKTPPLFL